MGGSKTKVVEAPAPPQGQTYGQVLQDYIQNFPSLFGLQEQYGPRLGELEKSINEQLYPSTAGLQELLAQQATAGINQGLPDDIRQQYVSDFNAGLGMNVNAPIGVSDRNVALTQLNKQWGDYYRNLGLSLAGRQPLAQGGDATSGFGQALNYANARFGNQIQGYGQSLANRIITPGGGNGGTGALIGGAVGAGIGLLGGPIGAVQGAGLGYALGS